MCYFRAFLHEKAETIRSWRYGRRRAPQWAIDKIVAELRKTAAEITAAAELFEKEKGRG